MGGKLLLLLLGEAPVRQRQQLAEAHYGVERRADFVAHVLHEARLGGVCQAHLLVGLLELLDPPLVPLLVPPEVADMQPGEKQPGQQEGDQQDHHQTRDPGDLVGLPGQVRGHAGLLPLRGELVQTGGAHGGELGTGVGCLRIGEVVGDVQQLVLVGQAAQVVPLLGGLDRVQARRRRLPAGQDVVHGAQAGIAGADDGLERRVGEAEVTGLAVAGHVFVECRLQGIVEGAAERIQILFGGVPGTMVVDAGGVRADVVGVRQVAVHAGHGLPADGLVRGGLVHHQAALEIGAGIDDVVVALVQHRQVAEGLPHAVLVVVLFGQADHVVEQGKGAQGLPRVVIIGLCEVEGIVVILDVARLFGNLHEVALGGVYLGVAAEPLRLGRRPAHARGTL